MWLAEIGSYVMTAISRITVQEFVSKQGVANETEMLFFPIMETLHKNTNSGCIQKEIGE